MKKFLFEYKALRNSRSETDASKRERVTVTSHEITSEPATPVENPSAAPGTIRTEEYKRDLAEFQARRSSGAKELPETPIKKKCGRHSLPVSCTDCALDHDNTFNYEKKSALKYKKNTHKRTQSNNSDETNFDTLPNIQFLFQNQVFMPGNIYVPTSYSEPPRPKHRHRHRSPDFAQRQIDFDEEPLNETPMFYKNNSLPYDSKTFLGGSRSDMEEVDGMKAAGDVLVNRSSQESPKKGDISDEKLWEAMSELKHLDQWADEQLGGQSPNVTKSDDSKSETSMFGLPVACASDLNVSLDKSSVWNKGKWGVVPVQIKKLKGATPEQVRKKRNIEVNLLRKYRHPNIILLMGLYTDIHNNVHIVCERCIDTLYGILHVQGRILSAQTAVQYALDISNALVFLRMRGYVHSALHSGAIAVTHHDAAKLVELDTCSRVHKPRLLHKDCGDIEPHYVNIDDTRDSNALDCEPLISAHPSETYILENAVAKPYTVYRESEQFRWQAPELFEADETGLVHPCSRSDVYSLCLVLWECCNAAMPWKCMSYEKLKELYTMWKTGIRLPTDGVYPGCLLSLLQSGLELNRSERIDVFALQETLQNVKCNLDDLEYIIIPTRLSNKKSGFSSTAWDTTSPTDSDCQSPISKNIQHAAVIHNNKDSSTESDKDGSISPLYEQVRQDDTIPNITPQDYEKAYQSDNEEIDRRVSLKFDLLPEKDYSSACSTPIAKIRTKLKDIGTPGMHKSDSTEYCSILSPDRRYNFDDTQDQSSFERPTAKLSRSFTPQSYKPLHIKVPEFNLDSLKSLPKEKSAEKSSYAFDIKNYSLPSTPIARSNKLRRNAWLSGEFRDRSMERLKSVIDSPILEDTKQVQSAPETPAMTRDCSTEKDACSEQGCSQDPSPESGRTDTTSGFMRSEPAPQYQSLDTLPREQTWSYKTQTSVNSKIDESALDSMKVAPLVAIHERWIYEAGRKTARAASLPTDTRPPVLAVKPASHCVDTLQKSLPQLDIKRTTQKMFRTHPSSPVDKHGPRWEFCQARDNIARNMVFHGNSFPDHTWRKDKITNTEELGRVESKVDQATDTKSIEEFIKELIRKEFQHLVNEMSDDASISARNEDLVNKGVANVMEGLKNDGEEKKDSVKSFSRVKINGNNKPLLQITFSRSGENTMQVLDKCVNVTICDSPTGAREKMNISLEDTVLSDECLGNSLKRCQAFSAIQEARSTEDLYIDDDLSTHMNENFGGKVKLIPLHGSLHEILCEREEDCCLLKVKQENGCDTIYFRCDNSDTESRDALDGAGEVPDTVVYKRSISLVEERIQRVFPKDKPRSTTPIQVRKEDLKVRPKSEIFTKNITKESRVLSNSSPSLASNDREVEVNIENIVSYQDSSSDECLKCQTDNDDFELIERKIEEDIANNLSCCCLAKISEENLSVINEESTDKESGPNDSEG